MKEAQELSEPTEQYACQPLDVRNTGAYVLSLTILLTILLALTNWKWPRTSVKCLKAFKSISRTLVNSWVLYILQIRSTFKTVHNDPCK